MRGRRALPSGLAAISTAFLSVVHAGDHVLVTDSAYGPTRNFCDQILTRLGVTTSYYDPVIGAAIADLFRPNTEPRLCRIARLAELRNAGCRRHRQGRA